MWFAKYGHFSLALRQLQPSCECFVLTLKSRDQSYEAQAMVFVNAAEVFSARCWRTRISSESYQKCSSVLNFCVNPFAVLWNRWNLHFRECVFARACHARALQRFLSFCFHNLHQTPQSFPKKEGKTSQFRKVLFHLFLSFILSILGISANSVPNTLVSCWLIICYAWFCEGCESKKYEIAVVRA